MCIGNVKEWETEIIPQELTPEYGSEWPLSAKRTFRIAMWITKADRYKLPGGGKRRWGPPPPGVALEPPARAGGHLDDDVDMRLAAGPDRVPAGAEHDDDKVYA